MSWCQIYNMLLVTTTRSLYGITWIILRYSRHNLFKCMFSSSRQPPSVSQFLAGSSFHSDNALCRLVVVTDNTILLFDRKTCDRQLIIACNMSSPITLSFVDIRAPFYWHGLTSISACISNYIHYNVWDEIIYPYLKVNGCTVEV